MSYTVVPVGNQFVRNFPVPLDKDFVFDTTEARNSYLTNISTSGIAYTGMIVADLETNRAYLLDSNRQWVEVGEKITDIFGSSNSGILIKTGADSYRVGGLAEGNNILISNASGIDANPIISLSPSLSGLQYIQVTGTGPNGGIVTSGDLIASNIDVKNNITVSGNFTVAGTGVTFEQATVVLQTLSVAGSGSFGTGLTVSGISVSLDGHGHDWDDINLGDKAAFCEDVGDCVNTAFVGSSGVQLVYASGNNTLRAALSGEALAQHEFNSTGFIVRTGSLAYSGRSITNGDNITITNGDGINGNPQISLSGNLTGLTSVTATSFSGNLTGNASSASEISVVNRDSNSSAHYLTFVDSNNGSATNEILYTASGIFFAPLTNTLSVPNISGTVTQANTIRTSTTDTNSTFYITFVDSNNNAPGSYESLYTDSAIKYNPSSNLVTFDGDISASSANISNNLIVEGNLTVNGTTVTANVDSITVEDPILTLGKPSGTLAAESKDRGIEFVYPSGSSTIAATGFFGFDKSATQFIAARDVTISNEVVSVNNNSYLDARFNNIDGSTITASQQFSGPGSGLTGVADSLEVGKAKNVVGYDSEGGGAGSLVYQTAENTTSFIAIGSSGQFLRVNNNSTSPVWETVSYTELGDLPTIGSGILTLNVSGSGLSGSASFGANDTGNTTFTVTSNATPVNSGSTIVSRDGSGNFSANTITANLTGTATNADNINISSNSSTDTTTYLVVVGDNATGNQSPFIDPGLSYNANINELTTSRYAGQKITLNTAVIESSILLGYGENNTFRVTSEGVLLLGNHSEVTSAPFRVNQSGVITNGTWNGNTIGIGYGGTNITSYTTGDILYASATNTLSKLSAATSGNVLLAGTAPSWGKVGLTTHVSGTLPVENGGTGATTLTGVVIGSGTSAFTATSSTTPYAILRVNDTGNDYEFSTIIDGGTP